MNARTSVLPAARRFATLGHALFFVGGFTLIFVVGWGGAATLAGQLFCQYKSVLGRLGGIAVIVFGLETGQDESHNASGEYKCLCSVLVPRQP